MLKPRVTRPKFPKGYLRKPKRLMTWDQVDRQLAEAANYWLCSVRPNGRPHAVPLWGVWVDGRLYFDGSPQTRHARNIARNPYVSVHLKSGYQVVMLEGTAGEVKPSAELGAILARGYAAKYAREGYSPKPDSWDNGGLIEIVPNSATAWTSFTEDPTKFVF